MTDDDSKSGESFALFEIVQLANGDIVLRDPESNDKQLLKIQFAPEVRALLGSGALQLAKVMVEAAAEQINALIDANDLRDQPGCPSLNSQRSSDRDERRRSAPTSCDGSRPPRDLRWRMTVDADPPRSARRRRFPAATAARLDRAGAASA